MSRFILVFLSTSLVAPRQGSENAEGSEGGTDEEGGMEASHKRILQSHDTHLGRVLGLW